MAYLHLSAVSAVIDGNSTSLCNWYRLPVASLTAGLNNVPIAEKFSVMSRSRSQGTEVTIVTGAFPFELSRDITENFSVMGTLFNRRDCCSFS